MEETIQVGLQGSGQFDVTGGAVIESLNGTANIEVAALPGATGTMTVSGAGTNVSIEGIFIGGDRNGNSGGSAMLSLGAGSTITVDNITVYSAGTLSMQGGVLNAANGLTLDFGGNITRFGTVDTPNDPAKPLFNNGDLTGDSLAEPITLTGHVKGVGTCDNGNITGTVEIELGGTTPFSGQDQINHILGDGVADLAGELAVQLINGFIPA